MSITFPSEVLKPAAINWENPLARKVAHAWGLGSLSDFAGDANLSWLYQHPSHVGTKDGQLYLTGAQGGSDDDILVTTDPIATVTAENKYTVFVSCLPQSVGMHSTNRHYILRGVNSGGVHLNYKKSGKIEIGYNAWNGFKYYAVFPAGTIELDTMFTAAISIDKAAGTVNISINGVHRFADADSYIGSPSLMGSGSTPERAQFKIGYGGYTNYYSFIGYLYSVVISHDFYTEDELAEVCLNPNQLFKRQQDVQDEYGLVFNKEVSATQYVLCESLNIVGLFEVEAEVTIDTSASTKSLFSFGGSFGTDDKLTVLITFSTNFLNQQTATIILASTSYPSSALIWLGSKSKITVKLVMTVGGLADVYIDNEKVLDAVTTGLNSLNTELQIGGAAATSYPWVGMYHSFKLIDHSDPTNNRYWDFNQTHGNTVLDHYIGAPATLINFPTDSQYIEEKGNTVGYQFNGSGAYISIPTITLSGAFNIAFKGKFDELTDEALCGRAASDKGYIRVNSATQIRFSRTEDFSHVTASVPTIPLNTLAEFGVRREANNDVYWYFDGTETLLGNLSGDFAITDLAHRNYGNRFKGLFEWVKITDNNVLVRNYNFTTGDKDQIIETVNNNHATINNSSTTKWQRHIDKQVYTIGSGKDYATASNYESAVVNIDAHKVGTVYGNTGENTTISCVDQLGVFELKASTGQEADFKGGGATIPAPFSLAGGTNIISGLNIRNIHNTGTSNALNNDLIEGCHIDSAGAAIGIGVHSTNKLLVKDTMVSNCARGASASSEALNAQLLNCVFVDNGDYNILRTPSVNTTAKGATKADFFSTNTSNNNISSDATATGTGSQANVDFTGAFVDEASGDYRINQAWADTNLVGNGWNGSDIAGWAYYTEVATNITAALSGTITPGSTEVEVVNGGKTLIVTLVNDTWSMDFDLVRQDIIDGITSAQSELAGWNNEVRDNEAVTSVERTSDTVVTITLTASASYDITVNETITVTIPATALANGSEAVIADSTFDVAFVPTSGGFKIVWALSSHNDLIGGM
jgi:hypothetical protein